VAIFLELTLKTVTRFLREPINFLSRKLVHNKRRVLLHRIGYFIPSNKKMRPCLSHIPDKNYQKNKDFIREGGPGGRSINYSHVFIKLNSQHLSYIQMYVHCIISIIYIMYVHCTTYNERLVDKLQISDNQNTGTFFSS